MPKETQKFIKPLTLRAFMVDQQIRQEQKSRWPDWLRLVRLKKLRLMIKDKMQRMINEHIRRTLIKSPA